MRKQQTLIWMAMALATVAIQTIEAPSAQATAGDHDYIGKLQVQRNSLLIKESNLSRDYNELNRDLTDLLKRNDRSLDGVIDDINRKINTKYNDLRQVRLDLRDVESRMI
jgi:hypothetical protein